MIDEIDKKILNILQDKARIPNIEIARQVGMAPSAVLERIRKLENRGVIEGYEVRLNPDRFARQLVAFVTVALHNRGDEARLAADLAALPEVQEVHSVAGEDGFLLKLRVSGTNELGGFIRDRVAASAAVRSTRTSIVLATYKETSRIPIG